MTFGAQYSFSTDGRPYKQLLTTDMVTWPTLVNFVPRKSQIGSAVGDYTSQTGKLVIDNKSIYPFRRKGKLITVDN